MPTLKFILIEVDGPNAADHLREALGVAFPGGMPAGFNTTIEATEEVDEPTDLEPLDEPTAVEETPEPSSREPRGAVIAAGRRRAIEYLKAHGPTARSVVGRECDIAKGSVPFAFRHPDFTIVDGLLWLTDVPLPESQRKIPLPPLVRPVVVRRPKRQPPTPRQKISLDELIIDSGAVGACRDAISAELTVMEPQSVTMIVRRTKFSDPIVREALKSDRFRQTTGGYALA